MTTTQRNLAGLSRFIFRAPSWYASVGIALALAILVGMVAFNSEFVLEDAWRGVFYVGIPTIVASFTTAPIDRALGGQLTSNQASLLALFCELVVVGLLSVAGLIAILTQYSTEFVLDALLVAMALIFAIRTLVIVATSRHPLLVAAIPASTQTVVAAGLLMIYSGTTRFFLDNPLLMDLLSRPAQAPTELQSVQLIDFRLLLVMCVLYVVGVKLFLVVLDWPWRSGLGVSGLDFLQGFIGYIADGSHELESFFEDLGQEALAPVTVLSVRTQGGDEKARFVLPMIHPGPMGEIGGGNLSRRIATDIDGLAFPPHATAGHDFNLVAAREVESILTAARDAAQQIHYDRTATQSKRLTEGEATLTGQGFGNGALVVNTFAPSHADDIEYSVGLSAASEARTSGFDEVLLVDAHNCNDGMSGEDPSQVTPGSKRSFDIIHGADRLGDRLAEAETGPVKCGVAWDPTEWEPTDGIGPLGVRVAVFEVDGQRTAYVLVDGNNMTPGLRERVIDAIEEVDTTEVMTTDTHIVNTVKPENKVGDSIPESTFTALVTDLVEEAIADLEPVEVGMASETAEVTVFGNDRTEMMASTANAVVSLGTALAAVLFIGILSITIVMFVLTGG